MPATAEPGKARKKPKVRPEDCTHPIHQLLKPIENGDGRQPERTRSTIRDETVLLPVNRLCRHPDNRHPTPDQVAAMVESINREGQLEPILVRPLPRDVTRHRAIDGSAIPPAERAYQIVSGETRVLAQFERGMRVDARELADCEDDAKALELLAICNAQRTDLNPIQKARMIARLCEPVESGGAGMTREQAARVYGLESGQGASNLVKLLELPQEIQRLVETGELPQTFGLAAVPYCAVPAIAVTLAKRVGKWKENPPTRNNFQHELERLAEDQTRPMRAENRKQLNEYSLEHRHHLNRLFDVTDDRELAVVTLKTWNGDEERACNVKLWNKLQTAAKAELEKELASKGKKAADRSSKSKSAPKQLTPAEQKKRSAEKARHLADRIQAWRHRWLCDLVADRLDTHPAIVERMRVWLAVGPSLGSYSGRLNLNTCVVELAGAGRFYGDEGVWEALASIEWKKCCDIGRELVNRILLEPDKDPKWPRLRFEHVDSLAEMAEVDLTAEWTELQRLSTDNAPVLEFEKFFVLHDLEQLRELGRELGVVVPENATKATAVKLFTGVPRSLKLPKSIKPASKRKRRAK